MSPILCFSFSPTGVMFQYLYKDLSNPTFLSFLKMAAGKKKVGTTGRFGARYGLRVKQKVLAVERRQKQKHECPRCHKLQLKRLGKGIWSCKKCSYKFAGRAYWPLGE